LATLPLRFLSWNVFRTSAMARTWLAEPAPAPRFLARWRCCPCANENRQVWPANGFEVNTKDYKGEQRREQLKKATPD